MQYSPFWFSKEHDVKIRTRIATAIAALTAGIASLFIATPALAHEGHHHVSPYSSAGTPVDAVAVAIVMLVLLAIVLIGSTLVGNLFEKK